MLSIFISGLTPQSGKTIVTAGLAATMQSLGYSTSVYKPVQTGAVLLNGKLASPDLLAINNIDPNIKTSATYVFQSNLTPLVSAYESDSKINLQTIYNDYRMNMHVCECYITEGANSISSPIDEYHTEAGLIKTFGLPLALVVNPHKSSLGDVISGINYIKTEKVSLSGIIIDDYDENSENLEEKYFPQLIKEYSKVKILGSVPHYEDIIALPPEILISDILNRVDIEAIFGVKIAKLNS